MVFPALRALLGPSRTERLGVTFTELQDRRLGPAAFARAVGQVAALEQPLGLADLNAFTPPAE